MEEGVKLEECNDTIELNNKFKLWNKNFLLLFQGQAVSALGSSIYAIALGFWVFDITNSTSLMGTVMGVSLIPKIVLGIFSGVFIDRWNRKKIIVYMDLIRGISVIIISTIILLGYKNIWTVMTVGIIVGACEAFFNPCIQSILPDIVPKAKITNANSIYILGIFLTSSIGTSLGGVLYKILSAPILFLIYGITFIISGLGECFINISKTENKSTEEFSFVKDFEKGIKYLMQAKGILYLVILIIGVNFFMSTGQVLMIPYFEKVLKLGSVYYGYTMTLFMMGSIVGSIILSSVKVSPNKRFKIFYISGVISMLCMASMIVISKIFVIYCFIFVAAMSIVIFNTLINSVLQTTVPQDVRGKVLSIVITMSVSCSPLGMILGGILGDILGIKQTIIYAFVLGLIFILGIGLIKETKKALSFNQKAEIE